MQVPDALKLTLEPAANCESLRDRLLRSTVVPINHQPEENPCQTQQLTEHLKTLRLRGMASALEESLTALSQKKLAPTTWLGQLLQAEMADRQARSYEYQLRLARFPVPRDIDSFDFKESAVNETRFRQLYAGDYLTTARNIVLVGGTGTRLEVASGDRLELGTPSLRVSGRASTAWLIW